MSRLTSHRSGVTYVLDSDTSRLTKVLNVERPSGRFGVAFWFRVDSQVDSHRRRLAVQDRVHWVRRVASELRQDVAVDRQGHAHLRVSEQVSDDPGRHALGQHERGDPVPRIVEALAPEAGPRECELVDVGARAVVRPATSAQRASILRRCVEARDRPSGSGPRERLRELDQRWEADVSLIPDREVADELLRPHSPPMVARGRRTAN